MQITYTVFQIFSESCKNAINVWGILKYYFKQRYKECIKWIFIGSVTQMCLFAENSILEQSLSCHVMQKHF